MTNNTTTSSRTNDVMLLWNDNTRTVYDANTLQYLRKNSSDGNGSQFFNDHTNRYEKPRDIIAIDPELTELQRKREEQKELTRSASVIEEKKLPAHLRLHQEFY